MSLITNMRLDALEWDAKKRALYYYTHNVSKFPFGLTITIHGRSKDVKFSFTGKYVPIEEKGYWGWNYTSEDPKEDITLWIVDSNKRVV